VIELKIPDIGDFKDIPVIEVLVKPGDNVKKNDSLITLESEKAALEVPATADGVLKDVRVKVGDKVSKGSIIATLEPAQTEAPAPQVETAKVAVETAKVASEPAPSSNGGSPKAPAAPKASSVQSGSAAAEPVLSRVEGGNGSLHASPSIRRFARELGVDLHAVEPSGPNGRVTREDVQNFVKSVVRPSTALRAGSVFGIAPMPKIDYAQYGEIERKPLSRIKKISGPILHRNWVTIPHVTQDDDADVTDLEEFRKELNAELGKRGIKVTMLAFLIKAAIAALKRFPDFNSSLDGGELVYKKYYNIGFAADTPDGLLVPVIKEADRKGIADLAKEMSDLAAKAREGKLTLGETQGGTFTISSLGSIGGTYFTPIINAPEVAILGACRAAVRPVWDGEQFVPRLIQPLSLSYDHRVIDGAAAARFTAYLATVLADLRRALV